MIVSVLSQNNGVDPGRSPKNSPNLGARNGNDLNLVALQICTDCLNRPNHPKRLR